MTNALALHTDLPEVGVSAIRAFGALAFVLALFFAGVWLFRKGQIFSRSRPGGPRLSILESRPLGNKQSLHVVAYDEQRLLIGSSPSGITMLTSLPPGAKANAEASVPQPAAAAKPAWPPFAQVLAQLMPGRAAKSVTQNQ